MFNVDVMFVSKKMLITTKIQTTITKTTMLKKKNTKMSIAILTTTTKCKRSVVVSRCFHALLKTFSILYVHSLACEQAINEYNNNNNNEK